MKKRKPLKSNKGLVARTSLNTRSSLKKKTGLTTKTPLRPRSEKMEKIYKERRPFVIEFLEANPACQIFWDPNCTHKSVDVHEIIARGVGGDIVGGDIELYKATCRYCHTMITNNPKEAQERGFIKWSWEK